MKTTLENLQDAQAKWAALAHETQKRIDFLAGEIGNVTGQIVDNPDENERKELRFRRVNFCQELETGKAELLECQKRFELARAAVHAFKLALAQKTYDAADVESRAKRQSLLRLKDERLHFMNRNGRRAESDASISERLRIDIAIAEAESALLQANRVTKNSGAELAQIRSECEPPAAAEPPAKLQVTPLRQARSYHG